jgi:hypothetical protein
MARRSQWQISQCKKIARDESLPSPQRLENLKLYRAAVRELQRDKERMQRMYGGDELKELGNRIGVEV